MSRRDDTKQFSLSYYLSGDVEAEKAARKGGVPDQMRITVEAMCPGVDLWTSIFIRGATGVRLGWLVSALSTLAQCPKLGGQGGRGFGLFRADIDLIDLDSGGRTDFMRISGLGDVDLTERANFVWTAYNDHLTEHRDDVLKALETV